MQQVWSGLVALALWTSTAAAQGPEEPSPSVPAPTAVQPSPATAPPEGVQGPWAPGVVPFGYVKLGYHFVMPPGEDTLFGANNGFRLLNARLGLTVTPFERLEGVLSVDGGTARRERLDPLEGTRLVSLVDAYLEHTFTPFLQVRAGQFKAPFNAERLMRDDWLPFIARSIVTEGLLPPEGPARRGIQLDRQVGVQLGSERLGEGLGVQYALAVVNGNGPNALFNDNNKVAPIGRLVLFYGELAAVGLNAFYNPRTVGVRPDQVDETQTGYGADLNLQLGRVNVFAMALVRNTEHLDTGLPSERSLGAMGQVQYLAPRTGLEAGVRFAYLEPSDRQTLDATTELSVVVGYRPQRVPARLLLQYTVRGEEAGAALDNNSIEAMAQVVF
jgi:hypothetical protein